MSTPRVQFSLAINEAMKDSVERVKAANIDFLAFLEILAEEVDFAITDKWAHDAGEACDYDPTEDESFKLGYILGVSPDHTLYSWCHQGNEPGENYYFFETETCIGKVIDLIIGVADNLIRNSVER